MKDQLSSMKRKDLDNIARWELIFEMLSMERVEPFLHEMGLHFSHPDSIRSLARQFLEQVEGMSSDRGKRLLIQQIFTKLAEATDVETMRALQLWGSGKFSSGNQRGLFHWTVLLRWLAGLSQTHHPVNFPPLDHRKLETIIIEVRKRFSDYGILEQRLDEAEKFPRSAWEEKIYQKSEKEYSPLSLVSTSITDYRTQQILNFIKTSLSNNEVIVFLDWARNNANSLGIHYDFSKLPE